MDGTTFNSVFTFLALNRRYNKTENYDIIFATLVHSGDFYKIDEASKRLTKSSLSTQNKIKLIDFLKQISSHSVDTPLKKMSKGTYNSRLALLRKVGIHPVLIPKNYKPKAPSFLKNPLNDFPW